MSRCSERGASGREPQHLALTRPRDRRVEQGGGPQPDSIASRQACSKPHVSMTISLAFPAPSLRRQSRRRRSTTNGIRRASTLTVPWSKPPRPIPCAHTVRKTMVGADRVRVGLTKGADDEAEEVTEEQIIAVLRKHDAGAKAVDLARKHSISEATLYNWKAKYGGMDVSDAKRLRSLEEGTSQASAHRPLVGGGEVAVALPRWPA
jgi:hypothetical protein